MVPTDVTICVGIAEVVECVLSVRECKVVCTSV